MERGGNRGRGRGRGRGDEQWRQQAPQGSGQGRGQGWGRGRAGGVEPGPNYAGAAGFQPGSGQSSQRGGPSQAAPVGQGRGQGPPQAWGPQAWGRGRQQQQQFAPRPSVPPGSAIEETSRQMARVNIQEPLAPVNIPQGSGTSISTSAGSSIEKLDSGNLKPVKRPDAGGRNGSRQVHLIANHFKVEFQPNQQIFHYDVNITRASAKNGASKRGGKQKGGRGASTSEGQDLAATVSRADAEEIKNKLVAENRVAFRDAKPVYDGKKNLYSAIELPEGDFTVKLSKGEDSEAKEYKVTLTLANKLDGRRLADFLNRSIRDHVTVQQEMLQALDLVVREHPSSRRLLGICKLSRMARIVFWCMLALTGLLLLQAQGEGEKQSPINIQTANVQNNEALGVLNKGYSAAHATMINKGYEIQVAWSEYAGSVVIEGVEYKLSQSHWHQPSEHTINGLRYPFELHMVHISDDGSIAVIGILYEFGKPDDFLTKLEWAIHKIGQPHAEDIDLHSVNPNDIGLRRDEAYYRYSGSLTTYPFNEEVTWTVIKHPKTATPEQVRDLWNALNGKANSREVQPLNGRVVEEYEPLVDISETYKARQTILSGSS